MDHVSSTITEIPRVDADELGNWRPAAARRLAVVRSCLAERMLESRIPMSHYLGLASDGVDRLFVASAEDEIEEMGNCVDPRTHKFRDHNKGVGGDALPVRVKLVAEDFLRRAVALRVLDLSGPR